tara:strand:+ start:723 stop:1046 length:324 start_codon:yes stop_codon:yes gene_type:complete
MPKHKRGIIVEDIEQLAEEANDLLTECRESVDEYIAFARSSATTEQDKQADEWAEKAIQLIITNLGNTDMSVVGISALIERIHAAGLTLLEYNFDAMVREKFTECMA